MMKTIKITWMLVTLFSSVVVMGQDTKTSEGNKQDKASYYEMRAKEDAKYEQQFNGDTTTEEETFWKDQKNYEKELKRRDRAAYRAYMQGKRDAYAEHYDHCDHHCHHSDWYYQHATFYYYGYHDHYYYHRYPRSNGIQTSIKVGTPRVRLSMF